jgi:Rod binding domain-containing protein
MDFNVQTSGTQWQGQAQTAKLLELQRQYQNPENQDQKKLKKAAQEFEAIFVQQMLDAMDKTIDRKDSFLNGGSSEEYFRSMLNEEIAKSMTSKQGGSGFGLAESIYRQMAQNNKKDERETNGAMNAPKAVVQGTNGEVK